MLNQEDTANILAAVQLMRELANNYSNQSSQLMKESVNKNKDIALTQDYSNVINKLAQTMTSTLSTNLNQLVSSLEPVSNRLMQDLTKEEKSDTINIEIKADFPNANSVAEIEKAFLNMTNLATQRVHSTKKKR